MGALGPLHRPGTQLGRLTSAALLGPFAPALTFIRPPIFLMLTRGTGKAHRVRFETPRGPVFIYPPAVTSVLPHGTDENSSLITPDGGSRFVVEGSSEQVDAALKAEPPSEDG